MLIKTSNETVINDLQPFKVVKGNLYDGSNLKVDGYSLISYEETKEPICVVSDKYGVLQHDEVINSTVKDLNKLGINYSFKSITINNGLKRNTMSAVVTCNDIKFNVDGSDIMASIYIYNGTDGITPFTREFGFWRMICSNGLMVPQQILYSERLRHRLNIAIGDLEYELDNLKNYVPNFAAILEKAQQVKLSSINTEELVKHLGLAPRVFNNIINGDYREKYENMITEQVNTDTLWGFYQVLTNYLTHEVAPRSIVRSTDINTKAFSYLMNAA